MSTDKVTETQIVTPWKAECTDHFDYEKLVVQWGAKIIDQELIDKFEKVTGKPIHPWIKRGHFFAHRYLDIILDDYSAGKPIFLYTGRGPSSESLHLGHLIPMVLIKWLQDVFKAIVVFQIADDEKYYFKDLSYEQVVKLGKENIKDIIAIGFDPERTFIFSNREFTRTPAAQKVVHDLYKRVNINQLNSIFGFDESTILGRVVWPIHQTAAAFSPYYEHIFGSKNIRCLVVYAFDQDPYFRLALDLAPKLKFYKPASIISKFVPALKEKAKMSSTGDQLTSPAIFLNDTPKTILKKINKYAFSGGKDTAEEQIVHGANVEVDIAYQLLTYFELDDVKLDQIAEAYRTGKMLSGEIKKLCTDKIVQFLVPIQQRRESLKQSEIDHYLTIRQMPL